MLNGNDAGIVQEFRKNVDSFRESMDSICESGLVASQFGFVSEEIPIRTSQIRIRKTNPSSVFKDLFCGFVLYYGVQKIRFVDSIRRLILTGFGLFSRIQQILTNP